MLISDEYDIFNKVQSYVNDKLKIGQNPIVKEIVELTLNDLRILKISYDEKTISKFVIQSMLNHMAYIIRSVDVDFSNSDEIIFKAKVK